LRDKYDGVWIANGGFSFASGNKAIDNKEADLISFGVLSVANNDLPLKFSTGIRPNSIINADKSKFQ
jgi:2,4-dienoyl-CoA reductase-like NADH-dependent reductase (Old Yellow Enzyme family)